MKNKQWVVVAARMLAMIVMLTSSVHADVFMKYKHESSGMKIFGKTQGGQVSENSTWVAEGKMRADQAESSTILLVEKNMMFMLDHKKKTYAEMPLDFENVAKATEDMDMQITFTVTPTSEKAKIGDWNCKKYLLKMEMMGMPTNTEIWATEDIKLDPQAYAKLMTASFSRMPGMSQNMEKMVQEMQKIKGVQVKSTNTMNVMGQSMTSTTLLLEYKEATAPAGTFEVPANYKKKKLEDLK